MNTHYKISVTLLVVTLLVGCTPAEKKSGEATTQLQIFLEEFNSFDEQDRRATDMSAATFEAEHQSTLARLTKLRAIDTAQLQGDDLIDWKFAQSILVGQLLEQERLQSWKKNPRDYMTFTRISTLIDKPGDIAQKVSDIEARLKLIPSQLGNGMQQLEVYIPRFQELSVFMAENGRVLFDDELPRFITEAGDQGEALKQPAADAKAALEKFISFLKVELPLRPQTDYAIGKETYNLMLKNQFLLDYDADSLWNVGWAKFNATVKELEELAAKIDPKKDWKQIALEIKSEYPDPHKIIEVSQEWVDKSKAHVLEHKLVPIPWPERVKVLPRAPYLRKTSYYGNFSIAKQKDEEGIFTSEMLLNPFEDQWDAQKKKEYLEEHDWGVIIVTAPHETYGGHHVQGLYQLHNPRPIRKNNSVSIFSEGWGLYNEQLMQETGFFTTDRIHLRQLQLRLWRNARVIYDCGMHTGKLSYEDAIKLMTDQVGFLRWAAQLEVDASSASPGYFIGYFMGMTEILNMREAYKQKMGDQFTLSDFHERLLKIGSMPPSLMRDALMME